MYRSEKGKRFTQLYPAIRSYSELVGRLSSQSRRGKQKRLVFADNKARNVATRARVAELEAEGWVVVQRPSPDDLGD